MIPGPAGALEAKYHYIPSNVSAPIVIVLPPHPAQEGNMDHPIVNTLFRSFASLGFNVLRFNFRGCGKSQGEFTNGEGEVSDAAACLDWLQGKNPSFTQCWVAGFSFGAYVALQLLMRRPEGRGFVAVSPPVNLYEFNFLAPCPVPGLVIHGDFDEVTPKDGVMRFVHQISTQRRGHKIAYHVVPRANHHFVDCLSSIDTLTSNYVSQDMASIVSGACAV